MMSLLQKQKTEAPATQAKIDDTKSTNIKTNQVGNCIKLMTNASKSSRDAAWEVCAESLEKVDRTADLDDRKQWGEYIAWLVERVDKFRKAFGPCVKTLKLTQEGDPSSL